MDGARGARHASTQVVDRSVDARPHRHDWANAVVYYHGKGRPPRAAAVGAAFSVALFVLALLTALALLEQFA